MLIDWLRHLGFPPNVLFTELIYGLIRDRFHEINQQKKDTDDGGMDHKVPLKI